MLKSIIPIFLIILSGGLFIVYIDPIYKEVQQLSKEKTQYDEAFDSSRELREVRDKLLSKYNTFTVDDTGRLEKLLPDNIDNVRLVMDINNIASKYGMIIKDVKVGSNLAGESNILGARETSYGSITLDFSVTSSYGNFMSFIKDLNKSLRLVDIISVSFKSSKVDLYKYNFTIKTYWLK